MDELDELDVRLSDLNLLIQTGIRKWASETAAANDASLTPGEQKRIRERAYWNEIKANQGHRGELLRVLDELCSRYLEADPAQRAAIRKMVANKQEVLSALNGYMYRALDRFQSTADTKWLQLGVASIAIEDLQIDYRDTLVALGEFYLTSLRGGVDPQPLLHQVAALASADKTSLGNSTRAFLENFESTVYFESSVKPKLRRIVRGKS